MILENYLLEIQSLVVSLPIRKGDFKLAASYSDAHGIEQLKHSVDFLCKVGTEVLAVLPGKVTDVVDHFKEYGDKLKFAQKVNYVTIQHEDNLFSQYLHLGNKQTKVKVGMNVKQGQVIGATGLSGYMTKPHLHFHMCIMTDDDKVWKTVPVNFNPRIDIVRESYIFSDKTISLDLDKFESGESNLLLVAGLSASGKTTLAEKLAKKYKCEFKESDNPCLSEEDNKEGDPIKCYENIFHKLLKSKKRYIMEGVLVFWSCLDKDNNISPFFNECKNIPIIIMGESVMKSAYQGWKRDSGKISYIPAALKWYVKYGISDMKSFNIFKKARMNVSGTKIEEFKL